MSMDERGMMTSGQFSLGARGYDQDEVDSFLGEVAARLREGDIDLAAEAARVGVARFSVVTLGYTRGEVNQHMTNLRAMLERRAEQAAALAAAPAEEAAAQPRRGFMPWRPRPASESPDQAQGPVVTTDLIHATHTEQDVYTARVPDAEGAAGAAAQTADDERAMLFATALDLRIEGAVSMTRDELRAAIDAVRGEETTDVEKEAADAPEDSAAEPPAAEVEHDDALAAALRGARAVLDAFEGLLAGEMADLGSAARRDREEARRLSAELIETAQREAEQVVVAARLRVAEMVEAAERDQRLIRVRAERCAERVRRMAERSALRAAHAPDEAEPEQVSDAEYEVELDAPPVLPVSTEQEPQTGPRPSIVALARDIIRLARGGRASDRIH